MSDFHRTVEAIWRTESARINARVARILGVIGLAEDMAQDALLIALEQWPKSGIPDNPGAWLTATAKHRAVDRVRRNVTLEGKVEELGHQLQPPGCTAPRGAGPEGKVEEWGHQLQLRQAAARVELDVTHEDDIGDDLPRLIFVA